MHDCRYSPVMLCLLQIVICVTVGGDCCSTEQQEMMLPYVANVPEPFVYYNVVFVPGCCDMYMWQMH